MRKKFLLIVILGTLFSGAVCSADTVFDKPSSVNQIEHENPLNQEPVNLMFTESVAKYGADLNNSDLTDLILPRIEQSDIKNNDFYSEKEELKPFFSAMEKFTQSNVSIAYKNFNSIVVEDSLNDFQYMLMAYELSNVGLFNLAEISLTKVKDQELWGKYMKSLKDSSFPKHKLSYDDEIFLANIYTAINYNNLTQESISDLRKKDKILRKSDYADYLLSTALYKEKDYSKALWAINKAISSNSDNVNYLKFKAKILCEQEKYYEALEVIEDIESQHIVFSDLAREIDTMKYFVLSKTEKNELKAKYNLAYYMYLNNDYNRAIDELIPIAAKNKLPEANDLLAKIYFLNKNYNQANEEYKKLLTINKHYAPAYKGLGNICTLKNDYEKALKNFEKAQKYNKKDVDTLVNLSVISSLTNNHEKAFDFCNKTDNLKEDYYKAYYLKSKLYKDKSEFYLKKTLEYNPFYCNAWLDLANIEINKKHINTAKSYVDAAGFTEINNYRYYYYKGLISKATENNLDAENNFKTAIILYNKSKEANISISQDSGVQE